MLYQDGNGVGDQTSDGTATVMAIQLIGRYGQSDVPGGMYARKYTLRLPHKINPISTLDEKPRTGR